MSSNLRAALTALVAFGLYATHDAIVKYLGGAYSPLQIVFFSMLLGLPFATLMLMSDRSPQGLRPNRPLWVMARSAGIVGAATLGFTSFTLLPMAQAYSIIFAAPLLVTLLAIPILGERVGWHRGLAITAGLIGVLIALRPGTAHLELGHLTALLASLCIALVGVITRKLAGSERPVVLLIYPMMASLVVAGLTMPFVYRPMPVQDLGLLVLLAFFAWLAALMTIRAYGIGQAAIVAPMQYSQFVWAVVFGTLFFDEFPDGMTWLGAAIIIASGLYILWRESRTGLSSLRPTIRARPRADTYVSAVQSDAPKSDPDAPR